MKKSAEHTSTHLIVHVLHSTNLKRLYDFQDGLRLENFEDLLQVYLLVIDNEVGTNDFQKAFENGSCYTPSLSDGM